jgi:hypothetical protein
LVAVGILAAAYVFIVRPVLDTTSEAIREANKSIETTFEASRIDAPGGFSVTVDGRATKNLAGDLRRAFNRAQRHGEIPRLTGCIQRADGDLARIRRCTRRF